MIEDLEKYLSKLNKQEMEELEMLLEEVRKKQNFAPPSDDDFLAALGPCGK